MMICHCTSTTDREIRAAVDWMRAADPRAIITPGKVYRVLGRRPDCGGCMSLYLETMRGCAALPVVQAGTQAGTQESAQDPVPRLRRLHAPG